MSTIQVQIGTVKFPVSDSLSDLFFKGINRLFELLDLRTAQLQNVRKCGIIRLQNVKIFAVDV